MEEIWRDIVGYEGHYQVSNMGDVRSLTRIIHYVNNINIQTRGRIMKKANCKGYLVISLSKNRISKQYKIHRLVAMAFIPNPQNYESINHIDGDKRNNCVTNLEWCSVEYNNKHARNLGLYEFGLNKWTDISQHQANKTVYQFDLNGNYIQSFFSANEAERRLGISSTGICSCIKGRYKTCGGFIWRH